MKNTVLFATAVAVLFTACDRQPATPEPAAITPTHVADVRAAAKPPQPTKQPSGAQPTARPTSAPPSAPKATPSGAPTLAASGFDVAVHGFAFENYGNDDGVVNLDADGMRALFGDVACASKPKNGACVLSPLATQWMAMQNNLMNDGHCEGMAVLSSLMFARKISPTQFGASSASSLKLSGNAPLQQAIARMFVTQATSPGSDTVISGPPSRIVARLIAEFKKPLAEQEQFVLGIYKRGPREDGHALTPYAVIKTNDAGGHRIAVYDNNYPGQKRYIDVDIVAETFRYVGAPNPNASEEVYEGDAETESLDLTTISPRLERQACAFCDPDAFEADAERSAGAAVDEVIVAGHNVLSVITDAQGRRLGRLPGPSGAPAIAREIPGGVLRMLRTNSTQPPIMRMPAGRPYTLTIDGALLGATQSTSASVFGRGYVLAVENITLDPGQREVFGIDANDARGVYTLTYQTAQPETPNVMIGVAGEDADYALDVYSAGERDGQRLTLVLEQEAGAMTIDAGPASGGDARVYTLAIERVSADDDSAEEFEHEDVEIAPGAIHRVRYGQWQGGAQSLIVEIDGNRDGRFERTMTLENAVR